RCLLSGVHGRHRGAGVLMVVAIDGPAGAGKSTVARAVARELGFTYLDSGALYRTVALAALHRQAAPDEVAELALTAEIELGDRVLLDGRDVTSAIRAPEVSEAASRVAAIPAVREATTARQRKLLTAGDWVAEGRDIGTVVAPDAEVKIFLTASPEVRAQRRATELGTDAATVLADQTIRDQRDLQREHSPLRAAPDAVEVDTSDLTLPEVVHRIVELVSSRR
ncbi:MAG: (d)CMP kinase, partial [Solirubrobacteraceae bacterium]